MRTLIVVARECLYIWELLRKQFAADDAVEVLLDRREKERRQRVIQEWGPEQRRGVDRRCAPTIQNDVCSRQYVIVRPRANIQVVTYLALGGENGIHPSSFLALSGFLALLLENWLDSGWPGWY